MENVIELPKKLSQQEIIDRCYDLVENSHHGCEETTCDLAVCLNHGYSLWAIYLWAGTGASCEEFDSLYNQLNKTFHKEAEEERQHLVDNINHTECKNCGAIIYEPEWCDNYCSSCGS